MRLLKDQGFECDQKLDKLHKIVCELSTKQSRVTNGLALVVCVRVSAFIFIGLAVMYLTGEFLSCACGCSLCNICITFNCFISCICRTSFEELKQSL